MKVLENFSLLHHNTFAMDVKAKRFVEYQNVCELKEVLGRFGGNENRDSKKLFIGRGVLDSAAKVAAYVVSKYDAVPD